MKLQIALLLGALLAPTTSCVKQPRHEPAKQPTSLEETLSPRATEVKEYVDTFPDKIEGAYNVKKYYNPGSERVLIHLEQIHFSAMPGEYPLEEYAREIQEIKACQRDIHTIITNLNKRGIVSEIYAEGLPDNFGKEEAQGYSNAVLRYLTAKKIIEPQDSLARYIPGAEVVLINEGRIPVRPIDDTKMMEDAMKQYLEEEPDVNAIMEDREDIVLKRLLTESPNKIAYCLLYGVAHAFGGTRSFEKYDAFGKWSAKDNIAEYERMYGKRVSLIEITPTGLWNSTFLQERRDALSKKR